VRNRGIETKGSLKIELSDYQGPTLRSGPFAGAASGAPSDVQGTSPQHWPKRSSNVRSRGPEFRRVLIQLLIVRSGVVVDLVKKGSQLFVARNPIGIGNDFVV